MIIKTTFFCLVRLAAILIVFFLIAFVCIKSKWICEQSSMCSKLLVCNARAKEFGCTFFSFIIKFDYI